MSTQNGTRTRAGCDDSYEGLPEKIVFAVHAVRRLPRRAPRAPRPAPPRGEERRGEERRVKRDGVVHAPSLPRFSHVTHVLKIDDHDTVVDANAFLRLQQHILHPVAQWDFVGQRVIRSYTGNRRWHFDKVSKDSYWHERPYVGPYLPWADGAASYVLSAKAMDLLVDAFPVVDLPHTLKVLRKTEIYEDNMVAKVLYSADVEPREQDYGAVWTPEP